MIYNFFNTSQLFKTFDKTKNKTMIPREFIASIRKDKARLSSSAIVELMELYNEVEGLKQPEKKETKSGEVSPLMRNYLANEAKKTGTDEIDAIAENLMKKLR